MNPECIPHSHPVTLQSREGLFVLVASSVAALAAMALGYDLSIMSTANIFIREAMGLTTYQVQCETGLMNLFACPGALLAGLLAQYCGRRCAVLWTAMALCISCVVVSLASSIRTFCIGRMVMGLGVGSAVCVVPLYIAELVLPHMRGFMVTLTEMSINIGILVGFVAGYLLSGLPEAWRWRVMLAVGIVPPLAILLVLPLLPESPRWLVMEGRNEDAERILRKCCASNDEAVDILKDIQRSLDAAEHGPGWREVLLPSSPHVRKRLLIGFSVAILQHLTGIEAVIYYTPLLMDMGGLTSQTWQVTLTMMFGVIKVISCVVAMTYIDACGRRPLAITGSCLMALAHAVSALGFAAESPTVTILGHYLFIASYSASLGPLCALLLVELFPNVLRSRAMALATALNRAASAAVALSFLTLAQMLTPAVTYGCLAVVNVAGAVFLYAVLPETKGRTLEELEQDLDLSPVGSGDGAAAGSESAYGTFAARGPPTAAIPGV